MLSTGMTAKTNTLETALLGLLFNGTAIANIADNAAVSPLANWYVSLHTADPGEAGDQTTNEATYTGYARVAVARSGAGWTVTGSQVRNVAEIAFGLCTAGPQTVTHFGIGTDLSGAGRLMYRGALVPPLDITVGRSMRIPGSGCEGSED